MNKKILVANWKMNKSFDEAENWLRDLLNQIDNQSREKFPNLILCAPAILLDYLDELLMSSELDEISKLEKDFNKINEAELEIMMSNLRKINLGGQDCHQEISGSYTGDISALTLQDAGCKYVIIGHSERRKYHFESDEIITKKIQTALQAKLIPILCIGESEVSRKENKYLDLIEKQLEANLKKDLVADKIIVAYEPIWSIGTGLLPRKEEINEVIIFIKNFLKKRPDIKKSSVLYGGSVKKDNAREICLINDLDGLLLGASSLNPNEFLTIAKFLSNSN